MNIFKSKWFYLLIFLAAGIAAWYWFGLGQYFELGRLQQHHAYFKQMVSRHYLISVIVFMSVFTALIAAALPASPPLTLLGSYLFGFVPGFLYSLISCTLGAAISFIAIRYFLKRWTTGTQNPRVAKFNEQFKQYGASYLLMLHFLSVIPYVVITVLASLAEVPMKTFLWTLVVGSLPLLLLYSWTAREIASLTSVHDIFSIRVLIILGILIIVAFLPIIFRRFKGRLGV